MTLHIKLNANFKHGKNLADLSGINEGSILLIDTMRNNLTDPLGSLNNYAHNHPKTEGLVLDTLVSIDKDPISNVNMTINDDGALSGEVLDSASSQGDGVRLGALNTYKYLIENREHEFAFVATINVTKNAVEHPNANNVILFGSTSINFRLYQNALTGGFGSFPTFNPSPIGVNYGSVGRAKVLGIGLAADTIPYFEPNYGSLGGWALKAGNRTSGFPSFDLYRLYIEDLTLSGRTYQEVYTSEQEKAKPIFVE